MHITSLFFAMGAFLFSQQVLAQTWFDTTQTWVYDYRWSCDGSYTGYQKIHILGDTILNDTSCHIFSIETTAWKSPDCPPGNQVTWVDTLYGFELDDRVLQWHTTDSSFQLVFDFNLSVGDTLSFLASWFCDGFRPEFLIDSVGILTIHDQQLRFQDVRRIYNNGRFGDRIRVVERIGPIGTSHSYLFFGYIFNCYAINVPLRNFRCYSDSLIHEFNVSDMDCDYTSITSAITDKNSRLRIFPNPAKDYVMVETDNSLEGPTIAYDLSGRKWEIRMSDQRLDISGLPTGIYFVQFNLFGKSSAHVFVKM